MYISIYSLKILFILWRIRRMIIEEANEAFEDGEGQRSAVRIIILNF